MIDHLPSTFSTTTVDGPQACVSLVRILTAAGRPRLPFDPIKDKLRSLSQDLYVEQEPAILRGSVFPMRTKLGLVARISPLAFATPVATCYTQASGASQESFLLLSKTSAAFGLSGLPVRREPLNLMSVLLGHRHR